MSYYNSSSVCATVCDQYDDPATIPIVTHVDRYGQSSMLAKGMLSSGGGRRSDFRRRFKRNAAKAVKPHARQIAEDAYGSVWWLPFAWMVIKPLVMRIIESFIESMLFESRADLN